MRRRRRRARRNPDIEPKHKRRASGHKGKKKHRHAQAAERLARRRHRRAQSDGGGRIVRNPVGLDWGELGASLGVGFGAFAGSRFLTRALAVQVAKRKPDWAKHVGVAGNLSTFLASLFLARKWSATRKYETPLIWGTGLALAQTIIQTYFPKLAWIVADVTPDEYLPAPDQQVAQGALPEGEDWGTFNDAYDQGIYAEAVPAPRARARAQAHRPPATQAPAAAAAEPESQEEADVDGMIELDDDSLGVFGAAN